MPTSSPKIALPHVEPSHALANMGELPATVEALQERVSELEAMLERQERLATLGTIAGLIAHEFNNILTPVLSYAQLAIASPEDRALALKALQRAADGSERAGQIAGAILGLVRREHAPAVSHATLRCEVRSAIERAIACLARPLDKDGIKLEVDVAPGSAAQARGVSIEHVLLNLIINARAAMVPAGGSLTIRSTRNLPTLSDQAATSWGGGGAWPRGLEDCVAISLADTGRGFPLDRLRGIFAGPTASVPGPSAQDGERRGHGLGMLVCKRLVEDAGGAMAIESELGRGTTVWVVLPAADDDQTTSPGKAA